MARGIPPLVAVGLLGAALIRLLQPLGPLSASQATVAGSGAISGIVVDAMMDRPLAGALVSLRMERGERGQVTDDTGRFLFDPLPAFAGDVVTASKPTDSIEALLVEAAVVRPDYAQALAKLERGHETDRRLAPPRRARAGVTRQLPTVP